VPIVYLRSRRGGYGQPALQCYPDGRVQGNTYGTAGKCDEWRLHTNIDGKEGAVALQSWTGKYLAANPNNGEAWADSDQVGEWEKWQLVSCGPDSPFVALRSHHGKYLVCDDEEWDMWALVDHPDAMKGPGRTARLAIQGLCVAGKVVLTIAGKVVLTIAGKVVLTIAGQPALACLVPSKK
jgi:hypothetical protein